MLSELVFKLVNRKIVMFSCMIGCIARDWLWLLGWTILGALVGAIIGAGSITVTGGFSWPSVFIGAGGGAFIGFMWAISVTAARCYKACRG